jgi:HAD superfamily hydrolase (TIGR01509 family)
MKTLPFEAIIFDHDGTLIDTETADFEACDLLYKELGLTLSIEHWADVVVGRYGGYNTLFDELILSNQANGHTHITLRDRLKQLWPQTLVNVRLMPGVEPLLSQLHNQGYALAVATASDSNWAQRWLTQFNLLSYFDTIATSSHVSHNKPAPDVYLYAAAQLGVDPARCLVFEDSLAGTQAAKAAGMRVVAVPSQITQSLDFSEADDIISGLDQISLHWIETLSQVKTGPR